MRTTLIVSYYVCAALGLLGSAVSGWLVWAFSAAAPSGDDAALYGLAVFAVSAAVLTALPLLAAWQVRRNGSLLLPILYALTIIGAFPVGTAVGIAQVAAAWKLKTRPA